MDFTRLTPERLHEMKRTHLRRIEVCLRYLEQEIPSEAAASLRAINSRPRPRKTIEDKRELETLYPTPTITMGLIFSLALKHRVDSQHLELIVDEDGDECCVRFRQTREESFPEFHARVQGEIRAEEKRVLDRQASRTMHWTTELTLTQGLIAEIDAALEAQADAEKALLAAQTHLSPAQLRALGLPVRVDPWGVDKN